MRTIKAGKWLSCGCCGDGFKTWDGYEDQDQDDGFGICAECQGLILERNEEEWDKAIMVMRDSLNPENKIKFNAMDRDTKKGIVAKALEDGVMTFEVVRNEQ